LLFSDSHLRHRPRRSNNYLRWLVGELVGKPLARRARARRRQSLRPQHLRRTSPIFGRPALWVSRSQKLGHRGKLRPIRVMRNRCPVLIKQTAADGPALRLSRAAHSSGATLRALFVDARVTHHGLSRVCRSVASTTRCVVTPSWPASHRWCRRHSGQQPRAAWRKSRAIAIAGWRR
jgi:hypothetical protein